MSEPIDPVTFRAPVELRQSRYHPVRVLLVGSCVLEAWAAWMAALPVACASDIYLLSAQLPDQPAHPPGEYDFQIVQPALRFVLPDGSLARLAQADRAGHEAAFAHAVHATRDQLDRAMRWNREHGLLTFVLPFFVPVQNPVGRLLPRYRLENPVYFVERLNEALSDALADYTNTYLLDLNEIHAFHGKRFVQEDFFTAFNHGGYLGDFDFEHDAGRLEPSMRATELAGQQLWPIFQAVWRELLAMCATLRGRDMVKMVVVDLDDTLWRGIAAERDFDDLPTAEGWPKGLWEALLILKRRGVILGIISKNDESRVLAGWGRIFGRFLAVEDFAVRRINWQSKAENMAGLLADTNLLARNVVYIDDNPAERAVIANSFPDIRVLGGPPLAWRRVLLWSPETQVADITPEAARRGDMVVSQVKRQEQQRALPRAAFLAGLGVEVRLMEVADAGHERLGRVLELINRTNQFNTTGVRWTREDCLAAFARGLTFIAFEVSDRFTAYGLVGAAVLDGAHVVQFVMSCRVIGLDVEVAVLASLIASLGQAGAPRLTAALARTERNLPCQDIYARLGFGLADGVWARPAQPPPAVPAHITLHGLGVQEMSAARAGGEPAFALIADLTFGRGGNEASYLGAGWSGPEPQHRWTEGEACTLALPRPEPGQPGGGHLVLLIDAVPLRAVPPALPRQRAIIHVDGKPAGTLVFQDMGWLGLCLPAPDAAAGGPLDVRIGLPDAAQPSAMGLSEDQRWLGLCFLRLQLAVLPPPCPPELARWRTAARPEAMLACFDSLSASPALAEVQRRAGVAQARSSGTTAMRLRDLVDTMRTRPAELGAAMPARLRAADRIFVYEAAAGQARLTQAEMLPLLVAMRRWGPATLLFAVPAGEGEMAGTVSEIMPGLLQACVAPQGATMPEITQVWLKIAAGIGERGNTARQAS